MQWSTDLAEHDGDAKLEVGFGTRGCLPGFLEIKIERSFDIAVTPRRSDILPQSARDTAAIRAVAIMFVGLTYS